MALTQEDIQMLKASIADGLAEQSPDRQRFVYNIELHERLVRVEERLKHQRELMGEELARMDQRIKRAEQRQEHMRREMLARVERAEREREDILARLRQLEKRFE